MLPKVATIDFETKEIKGRPDYPPIPVGVAVMSPGLRPKYLAWGHPTRNNCTKSEAISLLKKLYKEYPILCHHAKFDLDVAEEHLGLSLPSEFHDTEFLAFLNNPHEVNLKLKDLAHTYLNMPPDEQQDLKDWIMRNVPEAKGKSKTWTKWGAYISEAPGNLVGKYAIGDIVRTLKLFKLWYPSIVKRGMIEAYNRERKLMPTLLESERNGVSIAQRKLKNDTLKYEEDVSNIDKWLSKKLKTKDLDVDSNESLADALDHSGFVDEWIYTKPSKTHPDGKRSVAKDNIIKCINNKDIINVLLYRSKLTNAIRVFANPWLSMAELSSGKIYTNWNQVRDADRGTRTGRLSSNPNFQNMPKTPDVIPLPAALNKILRGLPSMRSYIVPQKGFILLNRDYSQQELRILGHFEDGALLDAYNKNPEMDLHEYARALINKLLHLNLSRKPIKNMGFGLIYGMGLLLLAERMGVEKELAKQIKKAYLNIFPGLRTLINELNDCAKAGLPIHTWGGREYYVEPPKVINGRLRTFEYKLLNVLIQGSAADCTKQAMINYASVTNSGRLLLNVHDEIMVECPKGDEKHEMKLLRESMEAVEFDVPMLSDGKISMTSWGKMRKCNY